MRILQIIIVIIFVQSMVPANFNAIADTAFADNLVKSPVFSSQIAKEASQDSESTPSTLESQTSLQPKIQSEISEKEPLQGHLTRHSLGARSLPEGREPDCILGHFAVGLPFMTMGISKPPSPFVTMTSKLTKKWLGKQVNPCVIKLEKLHDHSDGYFFKTVGDEDGPTGWMMPRPKVPGKDKVTPWAIYFDQ